jgi:hypothetical protein
MATKWRRQGNDCATDREVTAVEDRKNVGGEMTQDAGSGHRGRGGGADGVGWVELGGCQN